MKLLVFIIFLSFPALQSKNSFAVTEQERLQSQIEKQKKRLSEQMERMKAQQEKHAEQQLMKKRLQTAYPEATINSPDGYYLVSPSNVIRLTVVEHSKSDNYWKVKGHIVSQTEWYGRYFSLGQYILSGWWTPDTQQLSSQTLSIAGNCTKWIDVGWTFKFKPYVEKDKKQPIIGFAEVAEYHDRIPKATCRNQRINNDTCEFGRCNEWNDIFPYRYLIKSKDMALSLFSKIKQEGY